MQEDGCRLSVMQIYICTHAHHNLHKVGLFGVQNISVSKVKHHLAFTAPPPQIPLHPDLDLDPRGPFPCSPASDPPSPPRSSRCLPRVVLALPSCGPGIAHVMEVLTDSLEKGRGEAHVMEFDQSLLPGLDLSTHTSPLVSTHHTYT